MRNIFETPVMNIAMFEVENVVTTLSGYADNTPQSIAANAISERMVNQSKAVQEVLTFKFD